jgi:hypothetical protein
MKKIKLFEEFNTFKEYKSEICDKYGIKNYTINDDGTVDVDGSVNLSNKGLTELPLKFNKVSSHFYCHDNQLTSLIGSPLIVGNGFYCNNNRLKSLVGAPEYVGGDFKCKNNHLTTLEGCPTKIGGEFHFYGNPVYEIWKLIDDKEYLEIFLDYDMIEGNNLILVKLNDILDMMGKPPVTSVKGYNCI